MWLIGLIALASGAANPFQSAANSQLNRQIHAPLWAAIIVYGTGLAGLLLALLATRQPLPSGGTMAHVNIWAWFGGIISLASTMAGLMLAHRMGSGVFTGLTVTAATVTSVLIDQLGLFGFRQHSASPGRLLGCALMIAGVWLVSRL